VDLGVGLDQDVAVRADVAVLLGVVVAARHLRLPGALGRVVAVDEGVLVEYDAVRAEGGPLEEAVGLLAEQEP
jgi:hypothetical protein